MKLTYRAKYTYLRARLILEKKFEQKSTKSTGKRKYEEIGEGDA